MYLVKGRGGTFWERGGNFLLIKWWRDFCLGPQSEAKKNLAEYNFFNTSEMFLIFSRPLFYVTYYSTFCYLWIIYSPFHETLPRSSTFVNWISVRFYETDMRLGTITGTLACWEEKRTMNIIHETCTGDFMKKVPTQGRIQGGGPLSDFFL